MKKKLGLDLGTNSIGWALIDHDINKKEGKINGIGSRIIPMSQDVLGKFDAGVSNSQTAERTGYRGVRRLFQRDNLRRERLHRVLNVLGFLPEHYKNEIDFEKRLGQFKKEVKLNYRKNAQGQFDFVFMDSFLEMSKEFQTAQSQLFYEKSDGSTTKIPYDWTIYYLRKTALSQKISKEELAWVLLNFNQKRGYYQLRGDELEKNDNKNEEYHELLVKSVEATDDSNAKGIWYNVILENGWIYRRQSKETLDNWVGSKKEFIVTTSTSKSGDIKRSFRSPKENDWGLVKKKTEQAIDKSKKHVCEYIYQQLLTNPSQKIRGKFIKTIERKYYKKELEAILKTQIQFHPELKSREYYDKCINELYPKNEGHKLNIAHEGFDYLLIDDIIFYQRPLKSKKSTISGCQFEKRSFNKVIFNKKTGKKETKRVNEPIKVIARSNPMFQEFRLWQFLQNLKIYQIEDDEGNLIEKDVTSDLLKSENEWVELFDFLNSKKDIDQKGVLNYFVSNKRIDKKRKNLFRWNYVEDKKYPAGETRAALLSRLDKVNGVDAETFLTKDIAQQLWHIIYSVKEIDQFKKALATFAGKHKIDQKSFEDCFLKFPPFKNEYGSYSEKAIKKLLPLMRRGKYFNDDEINVTVKERVKSIMSRLETLKIDGTIEKDELNKLLDQISDDDIPRAIIKSFVPFIGRNPLTGLSTYQTCYAVYDRHAESSDAQNWKSPDDIDDYLSTFKQHSLRNPIVEQVVTETLRTVRDIWNHFGEGKENFFDEIHVELGREMKNPAGKREDMTKRNTINENTNHRIKELLTELLNEGVPNVIPYSPSQQQILKIYEEGVSQNPNVHYNGIKEDEIKKIRKNASPTKSEIRKYKLWLEQGYISPYTGKTIPLSKLFTTDYQIEHIIPQSRFFDDSYGNKIICESEVNELKGNQLAYEFIDNHGGAVVSLGLGKSVEILKPDQYENHCNRFFKNNRRKLQFLLSKEVPEGFINRQLNDSRYISKMIKGLLANLVREEGEKGAQVNRLITLNGAITSKLKNDWGLNDKWNELIAPRFMRINELTKTKDFGFWDDKINAFRTQVPDELGRNFSKKRIDHRHHALDALVIACCSKDHINYITSLNTNRKNHALVSKLRKVEEIEVSNKLSNKITKKKVAKEYLLPWSSFPLDAKSALDVTIVSFKQNLRVINKTNNKTWQWVEKDNKLKKRLVTQTKGTNWAIRKSLHKDTVHGLVLIDENKEVSVNKALEYPNLIINDKIRSQIDNINLPHLKDRIAHIKKNPLMLEGEKVKRIKVYTEATAVRTELVKITNAKQLNKITDSGIKKILENHIKEFVNDQGKEDYGHAFSPEGVEYLNKNIVKYNGGKKHKPIFKVRSYEVGSKFSVGTQGNKNSKYVEAAKGTNLFFAIYEDNDGKRNFETIPLNVVIEHQKQVAHLPQSERTPVPINPDKGMFIFSLSPNDLVYVPTEEEIQRPNEVNFSNLNKEQVDRVYKMVSSSGNQCFFLKCEVANSIYNKVEFSALNKMEKSTEGVMIKGVCWKLEIDRLGKINAVVK